MVCQLLIYTNDLLGKFIPPPTKGAKVTNSLSGLSQIVLSNVCELCDILILSHCSVCLCDFTNKCRWLSVINKNGFKKVGAPLNPLWRSEVSWDSHPMSSSYYVHSWLPGRFLQPGPVLAPHVCTWLPCPCDCSHLPEKLPWAQTPSRRQGGPAQHPGADQSGEEEGRHCSYTLVCFCGEEALSSLASRDALILLPVLAPIQKCLGNIPLGPLRSAQIV